MRCSAGRLRVGSMRNVIAVAVALGCTALALAGSGAEDVVAANGAAAMAGRGGSGAGHSFGAGAQYWKTVDEIDLDNVEEEGLSWIATYQYRPFWLAALEMDVEMLPDGFRGAPERVFAPQAYAILGKGLYAALGIGVYYTDGEFADDPFYAARAGVNVEVLPRLYLDAYGIYRFEQWEEIEELDEKIDSDTVMAGLALRIAL